MKLVKSLLLGSAAGLMAVAGAQAADLPVRKAAPVVDYVRVCSAYGTGFFFIPGTETCLRISGRVRAEYTVGETFRRGQEGAFGWRARGQVNLDARTQTAYGTLRTFIRYEMTRNVGSYYGNLFPVNSTGTTSGVTVDLNKAFIQFAGITAGRATSFFDFYAGAIIWRSGFHGSDTYGVDPIVLAYTATFGSGFSATISLED
ncbi:MAG TPA: porin, partial [Salinarimonas sp.]|nr:porin [Salinarimonas sp.]